MKYTIALAENKKYILITVTGSVNRSNSMEYVIESHKLGDKTGVKKILMDMRNARNEDSIGNNYIFINDDLKSESHVDPKAKIALLVAEDDNSHDFIETVSINSGQLLRLFRDKDKALEYLNV